MYFKGIVMEVKDKYSIVMKDDATMARIKNKEGIKEGDTIIFLKDDMYSDGTNNSRHINKFITPFIAAAAILIMIIIPMTGKQRTYAVVSLDINPSIQLDLDRNKKILKAKGMNEDAKRLDLGRVDGMDLGKGLKEIKNILEKANYSLQGDSILVGFAQVENNKNNLYDKEIKNVIDKNFEEMNIVYLDANKKDLEEANKQGISLGRYLAKVKIGNKSHDNIEKLNVESIFKLIKQNKDTEKETSNNIKDKINDNKDNRFYEESAYNSDEEDVKVESNGNQGNDGNHNGQEGNQGNNGNHNGQEGNQGNNGNHNGQEGNQGNNGNHNGQEGNQGNNGNHNGQEENQGNNETDVDENKDDEDKDSNETDVDENKDDEDKDNNETDVDDNKDDEDKDSNETDVDDNKGDEDKDSNETDVDENKDDEDKDNNETDVDDNKDDEDKDNNETDVDDNKDDEDKDNNETDVDDNKDDEDKDNNETDVDNNKGDNKTDKDECNHHHNGNCNIDCDNKGNIIIIISPNM